MSARIAALLWLHKDTPMPIDDIAAHLELARGSLAEGLRDAERARLITWTKLPGHGKKHFYELTVGRNSEWEFPIWEMEQFLDEVIQPSVDLCAELLERKNIPPEMIRNVAQFYELMRAQRTHCAKCRKMTPKEFKEASKHWGVEVQNHAHHSENDEK
jgi:DNA-binding transcriptional regulator GbsR (MarR family)